jgi:quinol monooxygenase YgiN
MTAKPRKENELHEALLALIEPSRKEPDCIAYELWHDLNNPRSFIVYERFKNRLALDHHLKMAYIKHFMENFYTHCVESHWDLDLTTKY